MPLPGAHLTERAVALTPDPVRALADLDVLILDCQSTGASPKFGVVLELAWAVARANRDAIETECHFITLPDGHRVPEQVRQLTGYDPESCTASIAPEDAWQRLRAAMSHDASAPTAIHYARFELAFLRDWAARFEPETEFPLDAICVHALAKRLYPDLPRSSLRALAGFLGHSLHLTRSSRGHVEATAFVWRKLCAELAARGIETWEALAAFMTEKVKAPPRGKKPKYPIDRARIKALPNEPGVYRFLRSNGDVLYVGKATNLRTRTSSHFSSRTSKLIQPEMLTQVSDIAVTVVASPLEAALLEHDAIRSLKPPYNVQLTTTDERVWYATPDFAEARTEPSETHTVGPLPSELSLRPLAAQIALTGGAEQTWFLRANAVGVSDLWTPPEDVFAAGWAIFTARHAALGDVTTSARARVLRVAKRLFAAKVLAKSGEESESSEEKSTAWDPERVARHLERAAAQAYQVYRRARWLRLLHDSDVIYREPESKRTRLLAFRDGALVTMQDVEAIAPTAFDDTSSNLSFDRTKHDRLRILTTELRRIQRDGGNVRVYVRASSRPQR